MSKSTFTSHHRFPDWEPDQTEHGAGAAWAQQLGFVMFFDPDTDDFNVGSDLRFAHNDKHEQLRRWLIDEINQRFPLALLTPEGEL